MVMEAPLVPADQSGSASEVPPSGGPSGPELPSMSDAPPSIRHNSPELDPVVTVLDMAFELSDCAKGSAGCMIGAEMASMLLLGRPAGCIWGRVGYCCLLQGHTWVPSAPTSVKCSTKSILRVTKLQKHVHTLNGSLSRHHQR